MFLNLIIDPFVGLFLVLLNYSTYLPCFLKRALFANYLFHLLYILLQELFRRLLLIHFLVQLLKELIGVAEQGLALDEL